MNYRLMWEEMKRWLEEAIEEGQKCGFDEDPTTSDGGAYYAYTLVRMEMDGMEGEFND